MSNQESLSAMQKNTVIAGILAVALAGWYFLFTMDNNMSHMNMKGIGMGMDTKPKPEMKMDMGDKSQCSTMDMQPKSAMKMDMGA